MTIEFTRRHSNGQRLKLLSYPAGGNYVNHESCLQDLIDALQKMPSDDVDLVLLHLPEHTVDKAFAARRIAELQAELDDAWRNDHPITNAEMLRRARDTVAFCEAIEEQGASPDADKLTRVHRDVEAYQAGWAAAMARAGETIPQIVAAAVRWRELDESEPIGSNLPNEQLKRLAFSVDALKR